MQVMVLRIDADSIKLPTHHASQFNRSSIFLFHFTICSLFQQITLLSNEITIVKKSGNKSAQNSKNVPTYTVFQRIVVFFLLLTSLLLQARRDQLRW